MDEKIVDLTVFRIEKSLRDNGFIVKKDEDRNIMILIKMGNREKQ